MKTPPRLVRHEIEGRPPVAGDDYGLASLHFTSEFSRPFFASRIDTLFITGCAAFRGAADGFSWIQVETGHDQTWRQVQM